MTWRQDFNLPGINSASRMLAAAWQQGATDA
jgi:hypothetical protein